MQARTRKPHRGHCTSSAIRGSGRSSGRNGCPGEVGFWSGASGGRRKHNKPAQRPEENEPKATVKLLHVTRPPA